MPPRRTDVLDIREIIRRVRLGQKDRQIARELGQARKTVAKYRRWAQAHDLLTADALADPQEIFTRLKTAEGDAAPGPDSVVEPYRAVVVAKRDEGVEIRALYQILRDHHDYRGSYSALKRFVRRLEARTPEAYCRVETPPGQEAQVDFGHAGRMVDPVSGRLSPAWVFVMTLSFSRHQYIEFVADQSIGTWLACHVAAFESFGGVVERVVIDNLKAGVARAVWLDPVLTRAYRDLAEHYGFVVAPCQVRTPRHKGKVESGVHYVKRNCLAGRTFADRNAANEHGRRWVVEVAGQRDHGTTHRRPLQQFETIEKPALGPLPATRYELTTWKQAKLHPDCHVVFEKSYYSAPHRLIGQTLWVKATPKRVEIHHDHERVATHPRAVQPGQRLTSPTHLPPAKLAGLMATPALLRQKAAAVGPATSELIEQLLGDRPLDRLRTAQGILRLQQRHGPARLEAACRRALSYATISYPVIKRILERGLEVQAADVVERGPIPSTAVFARPASDILGAKRWN
jgi:transposase